MWRASSVMWICITRCRSGWTSRPPRSVVALRVIDRLLATEDEQEEELRERPAEPRHPARAEPIEPAEPGHVEPDALDQLVEHERVLRLLDDLVVDVAELGRAVRAASTANFEEPLLQHALELDAELHLASRSGAGRGARAGAGGRPRYHAVAAEGRSARSSQRGSVGSIRMLRRVPVDVGVGVEVLRDRLARESREQRRVRLRLARPVLVIRISASVSATACIVDAVRRRAARRRRGEC